MKLHEFMSEGRTNVSAIEKIKEDCPTGWNYYTQYGSMPLYRGIHYAPHDVLYGDSSQHERVSTYKSNLFMRLIDYHLPSWEYYPKRTKSFICTGSHETAMGYGFVYYVFPVGNPIMGVCYSDDFWLSFTNDAIDEWPSIVELDRVMTDILAVTGLNSKGSDDEKITNLIKTMDSYSKEQYVDFLRAYKDQVHAVNWHTHKKFLMGYTSSKFGNFSEYLDNIVSPENNMFSALSFEDYLQNPEFHDDYEVWFSGPAYFLEADEIGDEDEIE